MKALSEILTAAEAGVYAAYQESAAGFAHKGNRGDSRELALRESLQRWLPDRFGIASGEVIDAIGSRSGQIDILIWDQTKNSPLLTHDGLVVLPVEAVLATVEVKSWLDDAAVQMVAGSVHKLRALRPNGSPWGVSRRNGADATDGLPSFFSSVVAYKSSIASSDWSSSEMSRVRRKFRDEAVPTQWLDRVVVLNEGVLLPSDGKVATFGQESQVLGLWYFQLVNFLSREAERRRPFPWSSYERGLGAAWQSVAPPVADAPAVKKISKKAAKRWLKRSKV